MARGMAITTPNNKVLRTAILLQPSTIFAGTATITGDRPAIKACVSRPETLHSPDSDKNFA